MFGKILIANRGEIACRVIATARRLGIRTVAVFSDADAGALHVAMADEAVRIGPPPVGESYLRGDLIIAAARATGAKAVHPGYGFLSENAAFVDAVEAAGLVFVGPPADAIRAMGLKDAAKALMARAGVPVVPGYHGPEQGAGFLAGEAEVIGYPVLIKARAGGGGKGMRLVERAADFAAALEGARREGLASFGDGAVLIERWIPCPRHVEIQVFADAHGNVVHLFERDCSLQRRHQKVIEEAPAPGMPPAVRAAMGRAAVEAARAIGYRGAGTVEFIADGSRGLRDGAFWFMEMNTRLQVEHPVSEAITGLDFVELQLRVAAGEPLPFGQDDLAIDGHAIEARVYAEDVPKGFLPATGTLHHLSFPDGAQFGPGSVRIDSGVRQGDAISPWYDPMIAKLIVHGADRPAALALLRAALAGCHVAGTVTNLDFLGALAAHPGFADGAVDTGLIGRDIGALTAVGTAPPKVVGLAVLAALGLLALPSGQDPWTGLRDWRSWSRACHHIRLEQGGTVLEARAEALGGGVYGVVAGPVALDLAAVFLGGTAYRVDSGGRQATLHLARAGETLSVFFAGRTWVFGLHDALAAAADVTSGGDVVVAPMPGLVRLVSAAAGQRVARGDALVVLEAMKMEHTLTAPRDGVVADLAVADGDQVTDGMVLVTLEPQDG